METADPKKLWCPYSDTEVPLEETTEEHIIPLAVGGHDDLTIRVHGQTNSTVGSAVDGAIANEFLVGRQRARRDVRGHSGREPVQTYKNVREAGTGRPLQVRWGKRLEIYDPIDRRVRNEGLTFEMTFQEDIDLRLRFLAKCYLSGGYYVYGDWFRQAAQHWEPRLIVKHGIRGLPEEAHARMETKVWSPYDEVPPDPDHAEEFQLQRELAKMVNGSFLVFMPGEENLAIYGGVLGQYLGMLNVPADTTDFPKEDPAHDLGHVVLVANGTLKRGSYRSFLQSVFARLPAEAKPAV